MSVAPPWAHTGETVIQEYTAPKIIEKWNKPSQFFFDIGIPNLGIFSGLARITSFQKHFFCAIPDTFGSNKRLYYAIIAYS